MLLTNFLPSNGANAGFLGRDEDVGERLKKDFPDKIAVRLIQTHSDHVVFLEEGDVDGGNLDKKQPVVFLDNTDSVFTNDPNLVLVVKTADCYPILLYHPKGVVGVVHAGRAGTEKKILAKALKSMIDREKWFKTGWQIWFGPKICADCYQINKKTDEHYDLKSKNAKQLLEVLEGTDNHALDSGFCTAHQNDWFYSYRKEGAGVGMNYGMIALGNKK